MAYDKDLTNIQLTNVFGMINNAKVKKPKFNHQPVDILSIQSERTYSNVNAYDRLNVIKNRDYSWSKVLEENTKKIDAIFSGNQVTKINTPFNIYDKTLITNRYINKYKAEKMLEQSLVDIDKPHLFVDTETMLHTQTGKWKLSEISYTKYKPSEIAKLGLSDTRKELSKNTSILFVNREEYGSIVDRMKNLNKTIGRTDATLANMSKEDIQTLARVAGFASFDKANVSNFKYAPNKELLASGFDKHGTKLNLTKEQASKLYNDIITGWDNLKELQSQHGLSTIGNVQIGSEEAVSNHLQNVFEEVGDKMKLSAFNAEYDLSQLAEVIHAKDEAKRLEFLSKSRSNMFDPFHASQMIVKQPTKTLKELGFGIKDVPTQMTQENIYHYLTGATPELAHASFDDTVTGAIVDARIRGGFKKLKDSNAGRSR